MQPFGNRFPVAILSFDRPHYLREVLLSLRPQVDEADCIILFQDGALNPYSGRMKTSPEIIAINVDLFRSVFPWGTVAVADRNLGTAENYERAEQEIFGRMQAPRALFLEDDLVLSPNYLTVTRMLLDLADREPRVGYVSAYGHLWASSAEQTARSRELIHMHENWGFAMTRQSWLAERPFRRHYLGLVEGEDYQQRNHGAIVRFYRERGWSTKVTSQDGARWIASLELDNVRLTTFPCHARNIGRVGTHATEAFYDAAKLGSSVFFTGTPSLPDAPTSAQIDAWLGAERQRFTTQPRAFYPGHLTGVKPRARLFRWANAGG